MNQTELMIAIAGGLFAAFLLGWLAGWLALRAGDSGADREVPPPTGLADMEARIAAADEAATCAEDDLRVAQIEIEELRNYIERKLAQTPGQS
ncbi:MAG TPA: hypothetical protein GXX24_07065 [Paracoccus solventivorans]|uniref:Uncharacterized protein n=1 Tax=Paracoccus solventivorans TaxID=53463 RepID=A0A832QVZ7_9RHOB|nr:hypothetical protein [Paracoccus solventivorans]HHW33884.1 hypothetical protein [Paracoccus solventivorans]